MKLPLLKEAQISGKTVFLRVDLDVPIKAQSSKLKAQSWIEDDARLLAAIPTIEYLLEHGSKVIMAGHLGRPQQKDRDDEFSLKPVAKWLVKRFKIYDLRFKKIDGFAGWEIMPNLFLLENLRLYEGEEKNDPKFAKKLADLADVYVNDAFAVSHRIHASIVGITKFLPSFAGFHLQKEIENLSQVLQNPRRPLVVVIGGKKIETKLPLVSKMYSVADYILVGGKIAEAAKEFLKIEHRKTKGPKAILLVADLNVIRTGILENSLNNFVEIIGLAKTIVWNGTMGMVVNDDDYQHASKRIAGAIIKSKAYTVVGGGDTTEFLRKVHIIDRFSFSSTGGGAMLSFLSGEKLPGLVALEA